MISIRKFVGYAGMAAGLSAALAIAMSTQTGVASTLPLHPRTEAAESVESQVTLSAACATAIQNVKAAFVADITEDRNEFAAVKLNGGPFTESDTDSTEAAKFMSLWNSVRTACAPGASSTITAPTSPAVIHNYSPSAACTAALQALKAAWALHPSTRAQWTQLQALAQAARVACAQPSGELDGR